MVFTIKCDVFCWCLWIKVKHEELLHHLQSAYGGDGYFRCKYASIGLVYEVQNSCGNCPRHSLSSHWRPTPHHSSRYQGIQHLVGCRIRTTGLNSFLSSLRCFFKPGNFEHPVKSSRRTSVSQLCFQISDFGLAKWLPSLSSQLSVSPVEGTFGYVCKSKIVVIYNILF